MPARSLNIFFDVDDTLILWNGRLRNHARDVFERLADAGHTIYIWSGVGIRKLEIERLGLGEFVAGYFVKPLHDYKARLPAFNVPVMPDFVLDDHPAVVEDFGGYVVPLSSGTGDRSLLEALAAIEALAANAAI